MILRLGTLNVDTNILVSQSCTYDLIWLRAVAYCKSAHKIDLARGSVDTMGWTNCQAFSIIVRR